VRDVCLVMLTADSDDFPKLRESKQSIEAQLEKKQCLAELRSAMRQPLFTTNDLETAVPEFRHFLYKSDAVSQFIYPAPTAPFATKKGAELLFRQYQHIRNRICDSGSAHKHSIYYEVREACTTLAWIRPGEFEMYASFTPLVTKKSAITACNRALRWIKKEDQSLFIL
jgi:hypothetical protein